MQHALDLAGKRLDHLARSMGDALPKTSDVSFQRLGHYRMDEVALARADSTHRFSSA